MKLINKRWHLLLLSCISWISILAQDPEFSQFYVVPQYLNPALIGFSESPRVSMILRDQHVSFDHAYLTTAVQYDQHFYKWRSSIGGGILADRAGDLMATYRINGNYAYQVDISDAFHLKVGMGMGYLIQRLKVENALFASGLNTNTGNIYGWPADAPALDRNTLHRFDVDAGIAAYSSRFFVGFSAKHITTPSLDFTATGPSGVDLPMRFSGQFGGTFYLGKDFVQKERMYVTPNLLFVNQGEFFQTNLGFYAGKKILFGGMWFRHTMANPDAFIILAGVKVRMVKIGYSYDFTVSKIKTRAGAHELSLSLDFGYNDNSQLRNRQRKAYQCPDMFKP